MKVSSLTWKIGGEAGYGIMTTGLIFSRVFARKGYHVIDNVEYPSLIRGGHNTYVSRINAEQFYSVNKDIDILVALNEETVKLHQEEMSYGGYIICDGDKYDLVKIGQARKDINYIMVPFSRITAQINAPSVMINNVALGATIGLIDFELEVLKGIVREIFGKKGKSIIEMNIKSLESGYRYVKDHLKTKAFELDIVKPSPRLLLSGNDAVFLAAVRAGCKFYAAYPMTPSSSILHSFASAGDEYNIVTKHAEDEIAVINMAIGASFAGARSMAATSGGGFSLMNEGLGCAAMTETPLVIVLSQRPAPATGLPTWSEQGDMLFAIHSSHGEFLRVVMAPGDPEECFFMTGKAFNIADEFQIPVIILLDKYLSESHFSCDRFDFKKISVDRGRLVKDDRQIKGEYLRYENTPDGISPRAVPGLKKGIHIANSDEHDQYGYSEDDSHNRKAMTDKRFIKIKKLVDRIPPPKKYGPAIADITIWSWGSCKGPILEAMKILNQKEKRVNMVHFSYLYPFDNEITEKYLAESSRNVIVENNKTSQLSRLIRMNTGQRIGNRILKYSGRQFLPEEIINGIERIE
ncbi:MAG: 2-oxoacid:acceptor oxidoreductase subunit alpha [Actinobacteria bacterium]|nr:2-oxoacid:acceptor oxidoreductase subunit alpha [Actinomycetota bacterium]